MTPERYRQIVELFQKVSELSEESRERFLAQSCAGDDDLCREVEAMLAADAQSSRFLDAPPVDVAAAVLAATDSRSLIGRQLGDYEVIARLGAGGMGEVFLAEDRRLGRKAALKLLPEGYTSDPTRLRLFEQEARAVSALNHPNIVTIYGVGKCEPIDYLATEFIDGPTLREKMATGPMALTLVIDIAIQTASALAAAHSAGIVHKDIKPENIIVRPDGLVKVLDFGLARRMPSVTSDRLAPSPDLDTTPGLIIGTPRYMSPEQARGLPVDARTDVFSIGCLLYELVAQRPAFTGATASDVIAALLTQPPAPLGSDCPAVLVGIIARATEKDLDKRYRTSQEMLADLRSALGEIEKGTLRPTRVHGGYRAAAVVVSVIMIGAAVASLYHRNRVGPIDSVAVMPFANGGGADLQYLADGLTESLIDDLSQVPGLKVISRNSVFRYKGREMDPALIGAALKAQAVLVGQLKQKGDRLSVQIELVDVRDSRRLWGEQYNLVWADLLQTRVDISKEVLSKLRVTLSNAKERDLARRQKINPEAYRHYLKGLFYVRRYRAEDDKLAAASFHQALLEDPGYALAYVGLADLSLALATDSQPPKEEMPRAREYALKALDLYGSLAEAHVVLGLVKLLYDWDWQGAEREFKYDSQMNPDSVDTFSCYLHSADTLGRTNEAVAKLTRLLTKDPMSPSYNLELGCVAYYARQYDTAISQYWRTVALDPGLIIAHANAGRAYAQKQMYVEAIAELEKGRKLDSGSPMLASELAYALAASGKRRAARTILNELKAQASRQYVDPYLLAPVYLQLSEPDEAFKWLEEAYVNRSSFMPWLKVDPKLDSVRSDPRYHDLLRRVGLY